MPFHSHFICFYQLHFSSKSKTIYKGNSVIKNIKCLIVFEFRTKLFGHEDLLGFGQPNLIQCLSKGQVDRNIFLLLCQCLNNLDLNDKLAKNRNSLPNCQNVRQKQGSQLKLQIGKPFTTRDALKQMKDVKKCEQNSACMVKHVLRNICLV